jgi:hypothetical protein
VGTFKAPPMPSAALSCADTLAKLRTEYGTVESGNRSAITSAELADLRSAPRRYSRPYGACPSDGLPRTITAAVAGQGWQLITLLRG